VAQVRSPGGGIQWVPITDCAVKLDTTRIYREAYEHSGLGGAQAGDAEAEREAAAGFADDPDGSEG
jgi:hypothetical protein